MWTLTDVDNERIVAGNFIEEDRSCPCDKQVKRCSLAIYDAGVLLG